MSRIRSLHPSLFTDDRYMALSFPARELIKGIWCEADDQGLFEWKPLTLKARIMPADEVNVGELLEELIGGLFLRRFEHDGRQFGAIRNFRKFQRPKKPNSVHLLPNELRPYVGLIDDEEEPTQGKSNPVPHQLPTEGEARDVETPPVPIPGGTEGEKSPQMKEEGGRKKEVSKNHTPSDSEFEAEFGALWVCFPRKVDRGHALKAYRSARKLADAVAIRDGVRRFAEQSHGKEPQYIAHPATWLNGQRWLDEPARPANGVAEPEGPEERDLVWRAILSHWVKRGKDPARWPEARGYPPGRYGCQVPEHLLREFGLIEGDRRGAGMTHSDELRLIDYDGCPR